MMDHSQHTLENHADHSMHHSMHDHAAMDHSAIMSTTTTTEMPANIHLNHDMNSGGGVHHHHHAAAASGGESMMHHAMSMAFHFGCNETILFDWWKIDSVGGLLGSMLAIFIMAVLYEGLKYYREFLFWKTYNLLEYRPVTGPQANPEAGQRPAPQPSASPVQYVGEVIHKQPPTMFSLHHFFQTFLHIVQVTVSFLLMLIFMTYNVWLCIAVVLGAGVGYFLFCWKKHLASTMMANVSVEEKTSMPETTATTTLATIETEMSMMMKMKLEAEDKNLKTYYNNASKIKAKATKINCEIDKQQQQHQPEQQLQYNRQQQLDYNYYEFKKLRIPRVQNQYNDNDDYDKDYDNDNAKANNETITIDNNMTITNQKDITTNNITTTPTTPTTMTSRHISSSSNNTCMMYSSVKPTNPLMLVNGCGNNIGANCSNCRNIKILLRLSLRYFYDINCEFVKNII